MRSVLALLIAFAMSLNGVGLSVAGEQGVARMDHAVAMNDEDHGSAPCDCCQDQTPMRDGCVACVAGVCAPAAAPPTLTDGSPIILAAFLMRPAEEAPRSRAPAPPRRPPRLVS